MIQKITISTALILATGFLGLGAFAQPIQKFSRSLGPSVEERFRTPTSRTYGLHLFFDETEFIDVLTLKEDEGGHFSGQMVVPNDFQAPLENIVENEAESKLSFDVLVPKNSSRPQDLVFHYEGQFFAGSHDKVIGFVTIKGQQEFVASFVAFLRP